MSRPQNGLGLTHFPEPRRPSPMVLHYKHEHDLHRLTVVEENPNGTYSSLWACSQCPDIFVGDRVGPIPDGTCSCGWVQKKWPRKKCEDCGKPVLALGGVS